MSLFHIKMSLHDQATGAIASFSFSPNSLMSGGLGSGLGAGTGYCMLQRSEQMMRSSSVMILLMMFSPGVSVKPMTAAVV